MGLAIERLDPVNFDPLIHSWREYQWISGSIGDGGLSETWEDLATERLIDAAEVAETVLMQQGFGNPCFLIACCADPDDHAYLVWTIEFLQALHATRNAQGNNWPAYLQKRDVLLGIMPRCAELFGDL